MASDRPEDIEKGFLSEFARIALFDKDTIFRISSLLGEDRVAIEK